MVEYSEYNGNPVIVLSKGPDDRYPFSFGQAKAKLIAENIEAVRKFAEDGAGEKHG
jgi:hypothetical protein